MKLFSTIAVITLLSSSVMSAPSFAGEKTMITMGGTPVALEGKIPSINTVAPLFTVVDEKFNPVSLSDFKGKTILISAVPSLDTGVCALQTKRFNKEFTQYDANVVMLTISEDLPFAQKRFCQTENVDKIKVLSDSVWRDFGEKYGLLIKDRGLLARSIFIIDSQGILKYQELVTEVSEHPNYDAALAALTEISSAAK
ncbi:MULTISPECIES: thiol peroxidase [unclassified Shewanella]|jgi:thiol peroxidase|uniref:thiol peroxidase n=1 Tax=unclassified Shewanella TaxID=196818 RepID=UPI000C3387A3|nr:MULTISPECIES: thiol peroxidase [unclassified Shewanella]MBO1897068.1 thiol peroxidase [Shewanella sp. BF02_Schw]PKH31927.1 thiol peroxidase [Shewanella sp. ALD9]QHS14311.1 thiol peroxidase [Shewanella sp. Arc9-LZ]